MPLVPLQIPPGFHRNGTDLEGAGRWRDGSLVRWREGSLRPIYGWQQRIDSMFSVAPRALFAWQTAGTDRWIAGGTFNKLIVADSADNVSDITPVSLTAGTLSAEPITGYGSGLYGTGFYGVPRVGSGLIGEATTWSLDNFGQYLVACSNADGKLYEWQLNTASPAAQIANAPINCTGLMVSEERFLFALGADGNSRKIAWCDQENNTLWTPASTNQAGSQILQTPGQIRAGVRTIGQTLVLTDVDAHRAVYVGPPFVYQWERVGTSCGIASRKAFAATDMGVFWMGSRGFFWFDGSRVQELPCPVWDHVFLDINTDQISKAWAVINGQNAEVWWFYPSAGSTEVNSYVAFDYKENHWLIGEMARTAGFDRGVFSTPIYGDPSGDVYDHETGFNYDGALVYAESGPASFGSGENTFNALKLIPEELTQGDVTLTFKTRLYPNGDETSHGPYTMTNPTSVRFSGRQARMRVTANTLGAWRFGIPRIDVREAGKR
jgi:hypothetical protein